MRTSAGSSRNSEVSGWVMRPCCARRRQVKPSCNDLRLGVDPDELGEGAGQALQPFRAGFLVVVFDAAARLQDLVGAHRRVADEDQLVVLVVLADDVPGRELLAEAAAVVLPHEVVDAVVEVVELQVLELRLGRREHLLDAVDVLVHGAAHVHQQQHLHVVVPLRHHLDVQPAGVGGGGADGVVEVQLLRGALARELAQPAQRDLDVARAQFLAVSS